MRSVVHAVYGEPAEVLALGESPLPEPGPGQARVRMLLSPIHNHDLWTVRGQYGYKPTLHADAGAEMDAAAVVVDPSTAVIPPVGTTRSSPDRIVRPPGSRRAACRRRAGIERSVIGRSGIRWRGGARHRRTRACHVERRGLN